MSFIYLLFFLCNCTCMLNKTCLCLCLWGVLPLDGVGSCRLFFTDDLHDTLSWVPASDKPHTFKSCFTHSSHLNPVKSIAATELATNRQCSILMQSRSRQAYGRACNFENMSALPANSFYTCHAEPNGRLQLRDTSTTRFYSNDIHLVINQSKTRPRCVPFCHYHYDELFLQYSQFS